jgi:hypothetical protein
MADGLRQRWLDLPAPSITSLRPSTLLTIIRPLDERLQPKEAL